MFLSFLMVVACNNETEVKGQDDPTPGPVDTGDIDPTRHDTDHDGTADAYDCDPDNLNIHPDAAEICNGVDDDCDGDIDGKDKDADFDKDNDDFDDVTECWRVGGELDCNDEDPLVSPDGEEVCNGYDDDCDGLVDENDNDGDGYFQCDDCDDTNAFIFPGAAEACDGLDNDCSGDPDELWDEDGDKYSPCNGDCDEENADINPGMGDICDGVDNDCSGWIDDGWDIDRDGYAICTGDCDDGNDQVNPGIRELCNGVDDDCDAATDEGVDGDGDGFSVCLGDCNDQAVAALPGGTEACDEVDNDCNGYIDELQSCWSCSQNGSYLVCSSSTERENARQACEGMGGYLVILDSSSEGTTVSALTSSQVWIGLDDIDREGDYTWVDGSPMGSYQNWAASEPDDKEGDDCVVSNVSGHVGEWSDEDCLDRNRFICEL